MPGKGSIGELAVVLCPCFWNWPQLSSGGLEPQGFRDCQLRSYSAPFAIPQWMRWDFADVHLSDARCRAVLNLNADQGNSHLARLQSGQDIHSPCAADWLCESDRGRRMITCLCPVGRKAWFGGFVAIAGFARQPEASPIAVCRLSARLSALARREHNFAG